MPFDCPSLPKREKNNYSLCLNIIAAAAVAFHFGNQKAQARFASCFAACALWFPPIPKTGMGRKVYRTFLLLINICDVNDMFRDFGIIVIENGAVAAESRIIESCQPVITLLILIWLKKERVHHG